MTTDNKTLADVQPGGRVRLGDQLPSMPRTHYNACGDGSEPLYTAEQMRDYARAALAAQPSPGGQGDSRSEKAETFLRQYLTYLRSSPRQGLRPRWCDVYEALEVAIEALAARQPVGQEPVARLIEAVEGECDGLAISRATAEAILAHVSPAGQAATAYLVDGRIEQGLFFGRASAEAMATMNAGEVVPLYATPPAQAVDLGDFKALYRAYVRLLVSGRDRIRDLGGACDPVDVMEANDVDLQATRRVIDSQAVGNGH